MLFSKSTEYSIKILLFLIDKDDRTYLKARNIAKTLNLPQEYVAKILQTLAKNKIITSMKGKGGGFKVIEKNKNLKLIEIINIFENNSFYSRCLFGLFDNKKDCECPMHTTWEKLKLEIGNSYVKDFNKN